MNETKIKGKNGLNGDEMMTAMRHIDLLILLMGVHCNPLQKKYLNRYWIEQIEKHSTKEEILALHEHFDNLLEEKVSQ
jgi:hypothetical protein